MLNRSELALCHNIDIAACDPSSLVDLRDISIDTSSSVSNRIESFLKQVRNPYLFKVDDIIMKVNYGAEKTVSDAFTSILLQG